MKLDNVQLCETQSERCKVENMMLTRCQDRILTENIWFVWSKTSYSIDERRCYHTSYCKTQPPASIGWVALSSVIVRLFVRCSSRIGNTSSYLHYMMFQTIQTIYFLWGYDPGNMPLSFIAELSPVYCCLVFKRPLMLGWLYTEGCKSQSGLLIQGGVVVLMYIDCALVHWLW